MPIVPESYGQRGGGTGGSIGNYQGQFTATTVKQRAFKANDYIVFDNGSKLDVYLAPVDIPINSPAPGQNGALWGGLDTTVTSGVSRADFDAALARKANAASLSNYARNTALQSAVDTINAALGNKADTTALDDYLEEGTFNIAQATLTSRITGNRNAISGNDGDISTLMSALSALQSAVDNLPSGDGNGEGVYAGAYANGKGYQAYRLVSRNNDLYWIVSAVANSNTDPPETNAAFVKLNGVSMSDLAPLRTERAGVELLSGGEKNVTNLNNSFDRTLANAVDEPSFSVTSLFRNAERGTDKTYLSRFERILLTVELLGSGNAVLTKTQIMFSFAEWDNLKALPQPAQNSYQDATIQDNRALVFNWYPDDLPAVFADNSGQQARNLANAIETDVRDWLTAFRNADRTLYIGKTTDTNPRLLLAVKGYRGINISIEAHGFLGSGT